METTEENTSAEALLPTQFDHKEAEARLYSFWTEKGVFRAEVDARKKPFCVVIPPPNVTGILHMGHVLDNVPQDVMTRWHRMRGFASLWVPGTDHAGIATQNVVKKQLDKEKIDMRSLGRDEFIKRVWEWREKHGSIIIQQLKRLGCSCDWSRERFTMDEHLSRAVLHAFIHLYNKGLIYKGKRMINWCTVCGTALANDEVEHEEKDSNLWHFRYPILNADGSPSSDCVVVATTRPETMLGDTAVAVHPDDERYKALHGRQVLLPLQNRPIPVIADKFVDPSFGTGVVKVTPAHDPNDYQMGTNHQLAVVVVIGGDGKMTEEAGKYRGLDRFACRKQVVRDLEALSLVDKIEKYKHAVGECYRCNSVVEPLISDQWFVKMRPLAEKARQAVLDGRIRIVPESERHDYFHWMETIQDWCISRQLWWGHRIPIYYCEACGEVMAAMEAPRHCARCKASSIKQDEDVLDTWFSSQLWPFSTLGWPDRTEELKYWYPNSWLMSGRDILFFWDSRMIMAGLELMGDVPFRTLALHGLVRDDKGRKLSKSLGNSPDPLKLFDEYGTDAIRAAIALRYPMGRQDTKLTGDFYRAGQALITKLWNASRLLQINVNSEKITFDSRQIGRAELADRWIISRLGVAIAAHDNYLEQSDFVHAFETVSNFFWSEFCDWYLELIKPRLKAGGSGRLTALEVALHCARTLLKLMHPYIPFVTEELWQSWRSAGVSDQAFDPAREETIALAVWPAAADFKRDEAAEQKMATLMSLVRGVRDVRHHLMIAPKLDLSARLFFHNAAQTGEFKEYESGVKGLGFLSTIEFFNEQKTPAGHVPFRFDGGVAYVALPVTVDAKDLKQRLSGKIAKLDQALTQVRARLNNPSFLENAPDELIRDNQANEKEYQNSLAKLRDFYDSLA